MIKAFARDVGFGCHAFARTRRSVQKWGCSFHRTLQLGENRRTAPAVSGGSPIRPVAVVSVPRLYHRRLRRSFVASFETRKGQVRYSSRSRFYLRNRTFLPWHVSCVLQLPYRRSTRMCWEWEFEYHRWSRCWWFYLFSSCRYGSSVEACVLSSETHLAYSHRTLCPILLRSVPPRARPSSYLCWCLSLRHHRKWNCWNTVRTRIVDEHVDTGGFGIAQKLQRTRWISRRQRPAFLDIPLPGPRSVRYRASSEMSFLDDMYLSRRCNESSCDHASDSCFVVSCLCFVSCLCRVCVREKN